MRNGTARAEGRQGAWTQAMRVSDAGQRRIKAAELRLQVAAHRCGDCSSWTTRRCPREREATGGKAGPSATALICDGYAEKPESVELRTRRRAQLAALEA